MLVMSQLVGDHHGEASLALYLIEQAGGNPHCSAGQRGGVWLVNIQAVELVGKGAKALVRGQAFEYFQRAAGGDFRFEHGIGPGEPPGLGLFRNV